MPKGIEQFVSENRRDLRRFDATLIEVTGQRPSRLNFDNNIINIPTTIEVYTRSINDGLYSGHPDPKHGSGRGVAGDKRGSWTLVDDVEESREFTRDGRNAVRNALAGDDSGTLSQIAVGDGTTDASKDDQSLESENGRVRAWGKEGSTAKDTLAQAQFKFAEYGDTISEYGVLSGSNLLFNRITTSAIAPTIGEEIRVDINFNISAGGRRSSVVTDDGEEAIAESFRTENTVGINEYVFGDGTSDPAKTDTDLDNQLFSKVAQRVKEPETVTAQTVIFSDEPNGQPYTVEEVGLKDNTGRLLWRTLINSITKDSETRFEVYCGFRTK